MASYTFMRRRREAHLREVWGSYHLFWAWGWGLWALLVLVGGLGSTYATIKFVALLAVSAAHAIYYAWLQRQARTAARTGEPAGRPGHRRRSLRALAR
ncbi:MAG: hypothetical protein ACYST0_14400 [Planctomycetota bacterium]|jgi:hypothetical protein